MSSIQKTEVYAKWRKEPIWRLLAADNAAVILGVLCCQLMEGEKSLPSSIFHERVARDLQDLRNNGWDLPQTAQGYIAEWLSAGYLERSFPKGAAEEVYELSSAAMQALQFAEGLGKKHRTATQSRLSLVIQQLAQLAEQTDKNPQVRIARLEQERARIDAEIRAIQNGNIKILSQEQAIEFTAEIIALAQELVNDFRSVRDNFQQLNRTLREKIVESEGSRGDILDKLFSGVDVIAESEAGRSFAAFWRLLMDPEQSMLLEESTEQVLSRGFAKRLPRQERQFLSKLTKILLEQGGAVHDVLQFFARSLKNFVQSRSYQEQRRLIQILRHAQQQALTLKEQVHPIEVMVANFYLTSSRIRSISQLTLHDPSLHAVSNSFEQAQNNSIISLEAVSEWVAQSEINFRLIKQNIFAALEHHSQVSIAEILALSPAEQGFGSIIGYIALGSRHGMISTNVEQVAWEGFDHQLRSAIIPCIYFLKEKRHEFAVR